MAMQHLIFTLALLLGGLILPAQPADWQLAKEEQGIKVFTRAVPGETLKAFKTEAVLAAPLEAILTVITDAASAHEWQNRCVESRLLEQRHGDEFLSYLRIETPWPLEDRDLVLNTRVVREGKAVICLLTNAPEAYPVQEGITRMPRYEGRWVLKPQGPGRTWVSNEGLTSPGGSIPDWLANTEVVEAPYATLANLRVRVER